MNRYKEILDRVPDNPNAERGALSVPDMPRKTRDLRPFARFAAIALATVALFAVFSWQYWNGGGEIVPGSEPVEVYEDYPVDWNDDMEVTEEDSVIIRPAFDTEEASVSIRKADGFDTDMFTLEEWRELCWTPNVTNEKLMEMFDVDAQTAQSILQYMAILWPWPETMEIYNERAEAAGCALRDGDAETLRQYLADPENTEQYVVMYAEMHEDEMSRLVEMPHPDYEHYWGLPEGELAVWVSYRPMDVEGELKIAINIYWGAQVKPGEHITDDMLP